MPLESIKTPFLAVFVVQAATVSGEVIHSASYTYAQFQLLYKTETCG
jgi:hypothetical protein